MNWNELSEIWGRQPVAAWREETWREIERTFAAKQQAAARRLFWRDISEAGAGVLAAGVFAHVGWQMGRGGWPIGLAVGLMLGLSVFFLRERVRTRRARLGPEQPLLVRLEAEIGELQRQRRLLQSVAGWYLGPCFAAAGIFGATVLAHAPLPVVATAAVGVAMAGVMGGCGWAVLALNRRAVRRGIDPRLAELEALRRDLTEAS